MLLKRVLFQVGRRCLVSDAKPTGTALYDFHVENGGKIVNFGGFLLPVQYSDLGISASHLHTRKNASLFDVSHMLQTEIVGKYLPTHLPNKKKKFSVLKKGVLGSDCVEYFESICTADVRGLQNSAASLTVFTNEQGGILDDLIVTKIDSQHLYVVSNAARKDHDMQHMKNALVSCNG